MKSLLLVLLTVRLAAAAPRNVLFLFSDDQRADTIHALGNPHLETPHLDSLLVKDCRIEQRHSTVAVDGEVVTLPSPLEYRLAEKALRIVLPA